MNDPSRPARPWQGDLAAHTPMVQQYLGVTFSPNAGKASEATFLAMVPSWSPLRARPMMPPGLLPSPRSAHPGIPVPLQ